MEAVVTLPVIRRATAADAAQIVPMAVALYQLEELPFDVPRARAALDRLIGEADLGFAVVADDPSGPLAGYGICTFGFDLEFAGRDAFITEVLITEAWRGRGLGHALLEGLEREARASSVEALHLLVRPENEAALALYQARGYLRNPRLFLSKRLA
jgi:ribosomal protein S18 acetylase RimI-like enzyme